MSPVVYTDCPTLAFDGDTVYHVDYDHAQACDLSLPHGCVCRLPAGHHGDCLPFARDLVEQTGIRFS